MNRYRKKGFYTSSREDYLIAVYVLEKERGVVRSIDIAEMLGYSKPSVSNGVHLLIENGLVAMDQSYFLHLTEKGKKKAEEIYKRYEVVQILQQNSVL